MQQHRRRTTIDPETKETILWVEIELDSWLPITHWVDHEVIERFLQKEKEACVFSIMFDTRAFRIGLIHGPYKCLEPIKGGCYENSKRGIRPC